MALIQLELPPSRQEDIPGDVRRFLREARRRVRRFRRRTSVPGFVPCDYEQVYRLLAALADNYVAPGNLFCEWGSGYGVVACLAALLEFDAFGIEVEAELVEAARDLAADFDVPVQFAHGSFIPPGGAPDTRDEFVWLTAEESCVEDELGLATSDFDVIFAYPWPDEEGLMQSLFDRYAARGAVLATYHGECDLRLRRKR
jgi:hypothetical protein